jgi:chorismate mutase
MRRRTTDLIRRQLAECEALLAERLAAGHPVGEAYLRREIDRLRADLEHEEAPEPRGRRVTDRLADSRLTVLPAVLTGLLLPKRAWDLDD